ncbi:MAG: hypothetical protein MUF21_11620 [Gemmatimonadaceae bacterium]|nr:hypothetical protein [Gemmatimonadaceae bacterium]
MSTRQSCGSERRRELVRLHPVLNGIDFLEVADLTQRVLHVELLKPLAAPFALEQLRIEGGDVVRDIRVTAVALPQPTRLRVTVDRAGDFSTYTLRLVAGAFDDEPPADVDPRLASVAFSFKAGCPTPFDCRDDDDCGEPPPPAPRIDYLARDFTSFRQLMLDRMRVLAPAWQETSPADVMHALVELKAYVADYQAYQQDAVATEAYLHTARRRISVARHATLLGYAVHEGASARAWLQVIVDPAVGAAPVALPQHTRAFTRVADTAERITDPEEERRALAQGPEVFETLEPASLRAGHDLLFFHTWGDAGCCLPRGSTSATLVGELALRPGMVLVLEEVRGPETGEPADADRAHRQAVTLVAVASAVDPLVDPPLAVTEITWHPDDALRFPLCLSLREDELHADAVAVTDPWTGLEIPRDTVSVARGNIVLADHGRLVPDGAGEALPEVPGPLVIAGSPFTYTDGTPVAPRYAPTLGAAPLARVVARTPDFELALTESIAAALTALQLPRVLRLRIEARHVLGAPIEILDAGSVWIARSGALVLELEPGADGVLRAWLRDAAVDREQVAPADALPDIRLVDDDGVPWRLARSLLAVSPDAPVFMAETEGDGTVQLRFAREGDGDTPLRPGLRFTAHYRVGGGVAGNVGVEAIRHIVTGDAAIVRVRNPLPAAGTPSSCTSTRWVAAR